MKSIQNIDTPKYYSIGIGIGIGIGLPFLLNNILEVFDEDN
jgi:hypothetical protein